MAMGREASAIKSRLQLGLPLSIANFPVTDTLETPESNAIAIIGGAYRITFAHWATSR